MRNQLTTNSSEGEGLGKTNQALVHPKPRFRKVLPKQIPAPELTEAVTDKQLKSEGHAELYKYVSAQNDKLVASRESLINRLGNVRLVASFLLSVVALSFPLVSKDIETSHGWGNRISVALLLLTLIVAVYFIVRALLSVPKLIGHIELALPGTMVDQLKDVLQREELDIHKVLRQLSMNYLAAIETNKRYNEEAGQSLFRAAKYLRLSLFWVIGFLGLTLVVYVVVSWSPLVKTPIRSDQGTLAKETPYVAPEPKRTHPAKPAIGTTSSADPTQ